MLIGVDLHARLGLAPLHAGEELYFSSGHATKHKIPIECFKRRRSHTNDQPLIATVRTTGADLARERHLSLLCDTAELNRSRLALLAAPVEDDTHHTSTGAGPVRVAVVRPFTPRVPARPGSGEGAHSHTTGFGDHGGAPTCVGGP